MSKNSDKNEQTILTSDDAFKKFKNIVDDETISKEEKFLEYQNLTQELESKNIKFPKEFQDFLELMEYYNFHFTICSIYIYKEYIKPLISDVSDEEIDKKCIDVLEIKNAIFAYRTINGEEPNKTALKKLINYHNNLKNN